MFEDFLRNFLIFIFEIIVYYSRINNLKYLKDKSFFYKTVKKRRKS